MSLNDQVNARLQLDQARLALKAGLLVDATEHINESLKINSESPEARIAQAKILLDLHQPKQAMAALDAYDYIQDANRQQPAIAFIRAKALIADNHDNLAIPLLKQLARQFPDDVRPHRLLAGLYLKLNQQDHAVKHLQKLNRLEPGNKSNTRLLASLLEQNYPQQAIDLLRQYDDDPLTVQILARLSHKIGNLRDAEEYYRNLLETKPNDPQLLAQAANLAYELGQSDVAIERITNAIQAAQTDQQITEYQCSLATTLMASGKIPKAGRIWFLATRLSPENHTAAAGLIVCAMIENRWKLVRKLKKSLSIHTSRNERRILLAKMHHHATVGKTIARQFTDEPAKIKRTPLQTLLNKSVINLSQAAAYSPGKADIHFHLSRCADMLGNTTLADEALHNALSINPKYVRAANFVADRANKSAA